MAASTKLYNEVARIIERRQDVAGTDTTGDPFDAGYLAALHYVSVELADIFAADNPRFDRDRFLAACRPT